MAKPNTTIERLRELLNYDPLTGVFTWRVKRRNASPAGSVAGSIYKNGYRVICIDSRDTGEHRIAWAMTHGSFPENCIDHINGNRLDNRIANLRSVTQKLNSQNQTRVHDDKVSCRLIGATWDKMWGNWKAQLTLNKKTIYLGRFKTAEEAHQAYLVGKRKYHEGCTI